MTEKKRGTRNKKGQFIKGCGPSEEALELARQASIGNKFNQKLNTPELKKEAYKQYCAWIASGRGKQGFVFEVADQPDLSITFRTMEKYIRENPKEFPPLYKECAESKSYASWEQEGMLMMQGQKEKCQPAIYQMFMRNKFGWDKENTVNHTVEPEVKKLLEFWEND